MRKILFFLIILTVLAGNAYGGGVQWSSPSPWESSGGTLSLRSSEPIVLPQYTVANLPTLAAGDEGATARVTDGSDAEDCTTGGGSSVVTCRWTGSAWANAGDGQAAGSAEVEDQVFSAVNFNGDTASGVSQDDFYDLWNGVDSDDDGSFADETWLTTYLTEAELTSTLGAAYDTEAEFNALFAAEQDALTFGVADTNSVVIDQAAGAADDDLARFTASGIEGLTYAELAAVAGFESAIEGVLDLSDLQGAVTDAQVPDTITIDNATLAATVTVSDDEATNDAHEVVFTTDNATMESDGDLNYNPSTGVLSATGINAELEGANLDIANTTAETGIAANDLILIYDVTATANRAMTRGNFVTGIGAGQAVVYDIGDDGGNDSVDVGEIATSGDTNSIFTEPSADKILIDVSNNWPTSDLAVTSTITDNEATVETNAIIFTAGGALTGGNLGLESDGDLTYNPSTGTLSATILTSTDSIIIGSADIEEAELEILDGATTTTAELNILDGVTSTYAELNILDGATLSYTDLNIIDGVGDSGTLTAAELLYVDGVTSAIQTQLDARCLESVFGTALEADDLTLNGTTLELVAEIPHLDVAETIAGNWVNTANPWADNEVSDTITVGNAGTVDPDAMSGDTTDDDLIDQDVIEGFAGTTDPFLNFRDTNAIGAAEADEEAGRVYANLTTTTEDVEDSDMWFTIMQGGTRTTVLLFDESDDQWETTKNFLVPTEVYDATNWNGDMTVPTKDAVRDKIEGLAGTGTMTTVEDGDSGVGGADIVTLDFDGTVFNITESPDTEINIDIADDGLNSQHYAGASVDPEHVSIGAWDFGTSVEANTLTEGGNAVYNSTETPGGELGGTWASPTVDDTGITLTSITIGALLGVDSIDATGAVDMDYGSGDVTDHTFTSDGGTTVIDGSVQLPDADGSPAVAGEFQYDSTITGLTDGGLTWYDDDEVQIVVSVPADNFGTGPTDDYLVAYDAATDEHYYKVDSGAAGGDSISIDSVAVVDPDFQSGGDIDFVDTSNVVTANLNADVVDEAHIADNGVDSEHYNDGSVDSVHISTIVESIAWNAAGVNVDGTQCADPTDVQINSGPYQHTIICADNDASTMYGHVLMPDSWDGSTVTLELEYLQTAADTSALNADVAMQCRGAGETVNNTWGTEVAIDDAAVTGSNGVDHTTSAAVTPNGTCAGGDTLYWRVQLDATGTTTAAATLHFLGAKVEYTSNVGD